MSPQLGSFILGSFLVVTIADAPSWRLRPYVGLLGISVVLALAEGPQPQLARGMAGLVLAGLLIQRGEGLSQKVSQVVGSSPTQTAGSSGNRRNVAV